MKIAHVALWIALATSTLRANAADPFPVGTIDPAMPPFATVLPPALVADLVAFLVAPRAAAPANAPAPAPAPPPASVSASDGKGFAVAAKPDRLTITYDAKPFADYVFSDPKILRPHFQNVHAPSGVKVTRNHPPAAGDAADHDVMHPGLWLAFGDINGEDFWRNKARIEHARFPAPPTLKEGALTFADESRLVTAAGQPLATIVSTFRLTRAEQGFVIAWDAEVRADQRDLAFGDQEEMGLGARVATALTEKAAGVASTSNGVKRAEAAWGKQAGWCDYSGKLPNGQHAGIAILPDPRNPHPCWWHTRDYGVFVANPFGPRAGVKTGKVTVPKGQSLRLCFHVLLHAGDKAPDLAAFAQQHNRELKAPSEPLPPSPGTPARSERSRTGEGRGEGSAPNKNRAR